MKAIIQFGNLSYEPHGKRKSLQHVIMYTVNYQFDEDGAYSATGSSDIKDAMKFDLSSPKDRKIVKSILMDFNVNPVVKTVHKAELIHTGAILVYLIEENKK